MAALLAVLREISDSTLLARESGQYCANALEWGDELRRSRVPSDLARALARGALWILPSLCPHGLGANVRTVSCHDQYSD